MLFSPLSSGGSFILLAVGFLEVITDGRLSYDVSGKDRVGFYFLAQM